MYNTWTKINKIKQTYDDDDEDGKRIINNYF